MRRRRLVLRVLSSAFVVSGVLAGSPAAGADGPRITGAATSSVPRSTSGWWAAAVTVTFTCTAGSAPLNGSCPAPVTLSTSGADQSVSGTVTDTSGQSATATVSDLDIDLVAPTAVIKGVKKGKAYRGKQNPRCEAADALSGVVGCTIRQKRKSGRYVVIARATDGAGNVTLAKLTYKLKPRG